jgi:hypothetical protein
MNWWTWQKCCKKTIGELQRQGLTPAKRWDFCQRYLSYERRMQHCWVQVTEPVAAQLETDELIPKGSGNSYFNRGGNPM